MQHDDETLGPCGCVDYHMADCPTRQPFIPEQRDPYEDDYRWPDFS